MGSVAETGTATSIEPLYHELGIEVGEKEKQQEIDECMLGWRTG
jgi:hypothetical protein